jgi:hypothetical protein
VTVGDETKGSEIVVRGVILDAVRTVTSLSDDVARRKVLSPTVNGARRSFGHRKSRRKPTGVVGHVAAAIMLTIGTVGGLTVPADASSGWSLQPSPHPAAWIVSSLNGVVCLTAHDCVAVGSYQSGSGFSQAERALVERWDGKRWTVVPTPAVRRFALLYSVSCTAPGFCMATGWRAGGSLMERWNGTKWSVVPSPNRPRLPYAVVFMFGVSCRTSKDCFAVGVYYGGYGQYTQIEHWDGTRWSLVPSANAPPDPTPGSEVLGISCTSGTACVAVGNSGGEAAAQPTSQFRPLAEQWNGTQWQLMPTVPKVGGVLQGVKCTSNTNCFAVGGTAADKSLIERWDGTTWTVAPSPNRSHDNTLHAIKCVSATDCLAVGGQALPSFRGNSFGSPLIEHWNGTAWSIVPHHGSTSIGNGYLSGVACTTTQNCIAVGEYAKSNELRTAFIERQRA